MQNRAAKKYINIEFDVQFNFFNPIDVFGFLIAIKNFV